MKDFPGGKNIALLVLRLALGAIFLVHGSQKVFGLFGGQGLQATVEFFHAKLGIPPVLGYIAAFTEFLGGIALILGFMTRLAALAIGIIMVVAVWKIHWVFEQDLALFAIALALVLRGAGDYSLDRKFCKGE